MVDYDLHRNEVTQRLCSVDLDYLSLEDAITRLREIQGQYSGSIRCWDDYNHGRATKTVFFTELYLKYDYEDGSDKKYLYIFGKRKPDDKEQEWMDYQKQQMDSAELKRKLQEFERLKKELGK